MHHRTCTSQCPAAPGPRSLPVPWHPGHCAQPSLLPTAAHPCPHTHTAGASTSRRASTRLRARRELSGGDAIVADDLRVSFPSGSSTREVLKGVNLRIRRGSLHMLLGPNGCGKSTLLKVLGGLVAAGGGRVESDEPTGFVFQNPDHQVVMPTVGADVAFGLGRYDLQEGQVRQAVRSALELVNLGDTLQRPTHTLSGGQRQRVAIAGALAENPRVLLLDELTTFLDVEDQFGVLTAVKEITRRGTGMSSGSPSDTSTSYTSDTDTDTHTDTSHTHSTNGNPTKSTTSHDTTSDNAAGSHRRTGSKSHPGLSVTEPVTAVWVTHRFEELQYADSASYMENGRVVFTGDAKEMYGFLRRLGALEV